MPLFVVQLPKTLLNFSLFFFFFFLLHTATEAIQTGPCVKKISQGEANAKRVISAHFFRNSKGFVAVKCPGNVWIQMHILQ